MTNIYENMLSNFHCLTILDELGYLPTPSDTNEIVYNSVKKALDWNLGKSVCATLIRLMCSVWRLSENELLTNYELFEKLLNKMLHDKGADTIFNWIKREMLVQAILKDSCSLTEQQILNPNLTINDIIVDISNLQVFEFIRKIPTNEHIVFIIMKIIRIKLYLQFFDSGIIGDALRGLISVKLITNTGLIK